ncbi:MAG: (Fe-S)-binding protein, partial [Chloroflexi bacterium]|nr:(Fe-S)-binding protein [Chloroflexota bacterium]
ALYLTSALSIGVLAWGLWLRMQAWRFTGRPFAVEPLRRGAANLLLYVFGQKRLVRQRYSGTMHVGLFWGFALLFVGTALATIDWDFTRPFINFRILQGAFYLGYELVLDIAGLVFIAALLMALYRRRAQRPSQLTYRKDFPVTLLSLLTISLTGFLIEGLRIAFSHPAWGAWSPVGNALAGLFALMPVETMKGLHFGLWLFHSGLSLVWIAAMSWNENALHILTSPMNVFYAPPKSPPPTLTPIKLEEAESFGVSKMAEFTWQQRMAFDACTMCGRCEAACPAFAQATPLSPKQVILKLRDHLHDPLTGTANARAMVGEVITPEELFSCTTCMACVRECPVFIPIVDVIVDMRRYLTLSEGNIPTSAQGSLRNTTNSGNPWGQPQADRARWADGLGVSALSEAQDVEVLYWVGCAGSYDARNQKVAKAVVKLLQAANVKFAILGREEKCVGDWQRRMGEEYLFQTLAMENIETMKQYAFKTVIAHCPHCFNTLKNDYPQFGGDFEVMHHSQFIARLIGDGRLKLSKPLADPQITFHDSCYLGRYNGVFDAPREIIKAIPGANLVEMPRSRDKGLCCGGGGGQMWMEPFAPKGAKKVNMIRLEEAQSVGAKTVGTACSYCLIQMEDATSTKGIKDEVQVKDIAELAVEAL